MSLIALRIIGFIVLITVGGSVAMYLFTQDRRWLRLAWQVFKYSLLVIAVVFAFLVFERLVLEA
ncbi:MAG: hypothetical protein IT532_05480 [Burkholderiales bacterium]|nr:hypothetical protein [Burkholderiales bacterium]